MKNILDFLQKYININASILEKIILTVIIFIVFWLFKTILIIFIHRKIKDIRNQYFWRKSVSYAFYIIVILIIGNIWIRVFKSIDTFLGLLSAGVAIALKDLLINISGWIFIIVKKPFIVGDRIQINNTSGDVIDIRAFQFTILEIGNWIKADQSTGRVIHIPNGKVFTENIANYTQDFKYIWNEIPVLLTFESDWKKAKNILHKIISNLPENLSEPMQHQIKKASKKYMIYYKELNPIIYTSVKDCGVLLTIRYLCNPRHRRGSEEHI